MHMSGASGESALGQTNATKVPSGESEGQVSLPGYAVKGTSLGSAGCDWGLNQARPQAMRAATTMIKATRRMATRDVEVGAETEICCGSPSCLRSKTGT